MKDRIATNVIVPAGTALIIVGLLQLLLQPWRELTGCAILGGIALWVWAVFLMPQDRKPVWIAGCMMSFGVFAALAAAHPAAAHHPAARAGAALVGSSVFAAGAALMVLRVRRSVGRP
jgi:hypothetical protein